MFTRNDGSLFQRPIGDGVELIAFVDAGSMIVKPPPGGSVSVGVVVCAVCLCVIVF